MVGESYAIWKGALIDCKWTESPHVYKIGDYYYLFISEGGTGHLHAITVARSKEITGPYIGHEGNPVLTHRHLGKNYPIVNVGHGDLIETQNKEWWMVLLASRPYGGYYRNLGRETFLVPVQWEDDWPIMSPGTGKLEFSYEKPNLEEYIADKPPIIDHFDSPELGMQWNFIRNPDDNNWSLKKKESCLSLRLSDIKIGDNKNPSFVGRRQQHINFSASCVMEFSPRESGETAGMVFFQNEEYNYRFELLLENDTQFVRLTKCENAKETIIAQEQFSYDRIYLKITASGQDISFFYGNNNSIDKALAKNIDGRILCTDVAGGFVGNYIGMYASANGKKSETYAHFDWFEYKGN